MNRRDELMNHALDGEIDAEGWRALTAHLRNSPDAAALWEGMQQIDQLLRQQPMAQPPAGFSAHVMEQVRLHAESRQRSNGFALAIYLTILALVGLALTLGAYLALTRLFGPLDPQALIVQASILLSEVGSLLNLLSGWAEEYPMLPAIGQASIPLAIAALWVVVYYLPKDRLRRLSNRRQSLTG
mgnify:CR=1 FL=1